MATKSWGGARHGSGRKPLAEKTVKMAVFLTSEKRDFLKRLGGSKWINDQLQRIEDRKMKTTIDTTKFSEEERDLFIEGWKDAGGRVEDIEAGVDCPWCMPWYWCETIEVTGTDIKDWGAQWWEQCKDEVERLLKEDEERAKEKAEEEA